MAQALAEADKARFWTSPNPSVGCVLVRDGVVIGRGFTQPAGGDHAEVQALRAAVDSRGATAYVTLEPCAHHGRTGPCADALIAAGISRVVVACPDPHPLVAGRGLERLTDAGISVSVGIMAEAAEEQLRGFLLRVQRGYGRVRLKLGTSLDGRIAMASGESQWITGLAARRDVQRFRAMSCAILTGSGTALADDCALTVRHQELALGDEDVARATYRKPLRVLLDRQLRVGPQAKIYNDGAPTLVFHGPDCESPGYVDAVPVPVVADGLDLRAVLAELGRRGANEILVEAGPRLAGAFLQAGLVDELVLYQAPLLLGRTAKPLVDISLEKLIDGIRLEYADVSRIGDDLRIIATNSSLDQ